MPRLACTLWSTAREAQVGVWVGENKNNTPASLRRVFFYALYFLMLQVLSFRVNKKVEIFESFDRVAGGNVVLVVKAISGIAGGPDSRN